MGKGWVRTPEQEAYLDGEFSDYLKARKKGEVKIWRTKLHDKWEERWPERQVLINEWRLSDDAQFNTTQMEALGEALAARKMQLYNYIRWRSDAKPVRTKNPQSLLARYLHKVNKAPKKPKRRHTLLEIYSDNYYKSKLQSLVNDELKDDPQYASLPKKKQHAHQLSVYLRIRADCWKNESDEVKTEIQKLFDEEHTKGKCDEENQSEAEDDDSNNDEDDEMTLLRNQQECIDSVGPVITAFLQDCHEATGFAWQLVGGGLDKSGEIKVVMSSVGKTTDGQKFQDAHPDWQSGLVSPWYEFLRQRHPIEERHRRASLWVQRSVSETDATKNTAIIAPDLATIPSPQPQCSPVDPSVSNLHFQTAASPHLHTTTIVASPQTQTTSVVNPFANSQCQAATLNAPAFVGSQSPTAAAATVTSPQLETTPSSFTSPPPTSTFHNPTMLQSGVAQPPRPDSPMSQFLTSTSSFNLDLYSFGRDNSMSASSDLFDFSGMMNFSSLPSSVIGPVFGMDQHWNSGADLNMSGTSVLDMMPTLNTMDTSAPQNDSTSTHTDGFIPPNGAYSASMPNPNTSGVMASFNSMPTPNAVDTTTPLTLPTSAPQNDSTSTHTDGFMPAPNSAYSAMPNPNTSGMTASFNSMPTTNTIDTTTPLHSALPTSAPQNDSTSTHGFIPPSMPPNTGSAYSALNTATNAPCDRTAQEGDEKCRKRKTYEEQNAHCILPEGLHRARKARRTEGAEDENTAGPKKGNANKKGKASKRKK